MLRGFLIGLAFFTVLALGSWLLLRRPAVVAQRPGPQSSRTETNAGSARQGLGERAVSASVRASPPPLASSATVAAPAHSVAPPPTEASVEQPFRELLERDGSAVAESWKYRAAVEGLFARIPDGKISLESIDCRLRLCRLSIRSKSGAIEARDLPEILVKGIPQGYPDGVGAVAVAERRNLPDGGVVTTVYSAREGEVSPLRVAEGEEQ